MSAQPEAPPAARPLLLWVAGVPAPQGSKTAQVPCGQDARHCPRCRRSHAGLRVTLRERAKGVQEWRAAVTWQARAAMAGRVPLAGPVIVAMTFTLPRPAAHFRAGRFAHLLRDDAPAWPAGRGSGDVSKLARAAEDALTDAGVWADDALVTDYARLAKVYAGDPLLPPLLPLAGYSAYPRGPLDRMKSPGVVIRVWPRG